MIKLLTICLLILTIQVMQAQTTLSWQHSYGGSDHEYAWKTISTTDGGYAFVGFSDSNDGDLLSENNGGTDLWVAKINSLGVVQWSKLFGGTLDEEGYDILQTADGGFMVAGYTGSSDGDVTGHHGTSNDDLWVLKLNSSGVIEWNQCYGGTDDDDAGSIVQTTSGDFYIAGSAFSDDGDVSGNHSSSYSDFWVIKINSTGTLLNQKCVGGTDYDEGIRMILTSDGGCLLAGRTSSSDGDAIGYHGGSDMLVAKLNSGFVLEWSNCYGGTETEECNAIVQLADGTYMALGYTSTHNNGDVTGHHGSQGSDDFWLVKLTTTGAITWAKCYGGDGDDQADGLTKTSDNGFVMVGLTNSTNGDVSGFHNGGFFDPDIWVCKVNSSGVFQWQRCCGGSGQDEAFNVFEEGTGIFVVTGFTYSGNYDVTINFGSADGWILKVTGSASGVEDLNCKNYFIIYPNPVSDKLTIEPEGQNHVLSFEIISSLGQVVYKGNINNKTTVQTSNFASGVYLMKLKNSNTLDYIKIIKE
ncbi:MAG: T9SS type A sorting domain-containing protein [Bacteroidota bacterium]